MSESNGSRADGNTEWQRAKELLAALYRRRAELVAARTAAETRCSEVQAAFRGGRHLPSAEYDRVARMKVEAVKDLKAAEGELAAVKAQIYAAVQSEREGYRLHCAARGARASLDEYDLANALSEPQNLLRRLTARLSQLLRQVPRREGDTALLEAAADYLRRHGISV